MLDIDNLIIRGSMAVLLRYLITWIMLPDDGPNLVITLFLMTAFSNSWSLTKNTFDMLKVSLQQVSIWPSGRLLIWESSSVEPMIFEHVTGISKFKLL